MATKEKLFASLTLLASATWSQATLAELSIYQARHGDLARLTQEQAVDGKAISTFDLYLTKEIDKKGLREALRNTETQGTANWQPGLKVPSELIGLGITTGISFNSVDLATAAPIAGYSFTPPDTMGAVGSTQFMTTQNGMYRVHNKLTGTVVPGLDVSAAAFWPASVDPSNNAGGDPRVRFDRFTDTWVVSAFTRDAANRVVFARSDGPTLSPSTIWTYYYIQPGTASAHDVDCFADYPMLALDAKAYLFSANMFPQGTCSLPASVDTSVWVMPRATLPASGGNVSTLVTAFTALTTNHNVWTPMPADNYDPAATTSYWLSADGNADTNLILGTITYPGGIPSLGLSNVAINNKNDGYSTGVPFAGVPTPNSTVRGLDPLGFRPIGGAIVHDGSLWTTMTSSVDGPTGTLRLYPATGDRHSVVFFEVDVASSTLIQDGNIYDSATAVGAGPKHYFMGTVSVNGQGHAVAGFTATSITMAPSAAYAGRLAGDPLGQFGTASVYLAGTNTGNIRQSFETTTTRNTRWGDYSMTSVDPCDDMTFYTIQEYQSSPAVATGGNWATAVGQIKAPAPNVLTASPGVVPPWSTSSLIEVGGTDFYDPPVTGMSSCRQGINASVTGSVAVNSVAYNAPTSATANLDTSSASIGAKTLTLINPDGQTDQISIEVGCSGASMTVQNVTVPIAETLTCNVGSIQVDTTQVNGTLSIYKTGMASLSSGFRVANNAILHIAPSI